ncbi:MAG: cytochrome C [Rubrivivax sp.]|nr:MAG: cytochrome C [Rubrivivax sp.]
MKQWFLSGTALLLAMAAAAQPPDAQMQQARSLAATCANCHGTQGRAKGDMKPLAGMRADTMLAMLADFKNGNQPATVMHQITKGYTEKQLRLIAQYLAAQAPAPAR